MNTIKLKIIGLYYWLYHHLYYKYTEQHKENMQDVYNSVMRKRMKLIGK